MAKVKVCKKMPKPKKRKTPLAKPTNLPTASSNKYADSYLNYYDDIKVPTKRYDW